MAGVDANYLNQTELAEVVKICGALDGSACTLSIDAKLFDSNGQHVGTIRYDANGADAYVLYLDGEDG